ncbi:hypothetical protein [Blastomonas sp.]|uniref:hypothetical protein n=1 Tax=Blastomonas sp. TaxID=1909299 RepID=UPI003593428A
MMDQKKEQDFFILASNEVIILVDSQEPEQLGPNQPQSSTATTKSISRYSSDGTQINPRIDITRPTIKVALRKSGSGQVSCNLQGSGGNFRFTKSGSYSVPAGNYLHWVGSVLFGAGWIES